MNFERPFVVALLALFLGLTAVEAQPLSLRVVAPAVVARSKPFSLTLQVTNNGKAGLYFKRPWKWAPNGMSIQAVAADGKRYDSGTLLYDISIDSVCGHFVRVPPGETVSFEEELNAGESLPSLNLPSAGVYEFRWLYHAKHYPDEARCAEPGWPVWAGVASSLSVRVEVTE